MSMGSVPTVWREQEDVTVIKAGKELPALWVRSSMPKCPEPEKNNSTFYSLCRPDSRSVNEVSLRLSLRDCGRCLWRRM